MTVFLYIPQSDKTGKFYTGTSADLDDRLQRHNDGKSRATKSGCPWRLVYTERYAVRGDAMKREYEIKSWKSHRRIEALIRGGNTADS
jgi:putative endonuclease